MKSCSRKILLPVFLVVVSMLSCFGLVACNSDVPSKLSNDSGFSVEGGGFEEGSVLNSVKVENLSETAEEIFEKLVDFGVTVTNKAKAFIYDIFVSFGGKEVQPNGKVKVSVPASESESASEYNVYHVTSDNKIEKLTATYVDGKISFETTGFSYYVFVPTDAININPSTPPVAGSEDEWNSVVDYYSRQTSVKVVVRCANDNDPPQSGAQIMIYQFNGTAYSEDGYFENELSSQLYKGKIFYLVKNGNTYSRVEWQDMGGEDNWELVTSEYGAEDSYNWAVNNEIYGRLDDYKFSDFTYNQTEDIYEKTETDKRITIAFTFDNNTVTEIKIVETETGREVTTTITFDDVEVIVPTEEAAD